MPRAVLLLLLLPLLAGAGAPPPPPLPMTIAVVRAKAQALFGVQRAGARVCAPSLLRLFAAAQAMYPAPPACWGSAIGANRFIKGAQVAQ
jgi:hypothetical protein